MTTDVLPFGFDFTDPDVNLAGVPHDELTLLRQSSPIHWVEQAESARAGGGEDPAARLVGINRRLAAPAMCPHPGVSSTRSLTIIHIRVCVHTLLQSCMHSPAAPQGAP